MRPSLSLSTKSVHALIALVLVAVMSSSAVLYFGWRAHRADQAISHEVADIVTAGDLQVTLLRQRLAVGAYILSDGDIARLKEIDEREAEFQHLLTQLDDTAQRQDEKELIRGVRSADQRYDEGRKRVVALFDAGKKPEARELFLGEMTDRYRADLAAAEAVVNINRGDVHRALAENGSSMRQLGWVMVASTGLTMLLGLGTIWLLVSGVFGPIRKLAQRAREVAGLSPEGESSGGAASDELEQLGYYFRTLTYQAAEARTEAARSRSELQQSERMAAIGNVVAHVSHEFKNALVSIGGYARLIHRRPDDPERVREQAEIIEKVSQRMEHLVREAMDFSRPMSMTPVVQSLNSAVRDAVESVHSQVPPGVIVTLELEEALPHAPFDCEHLHRVITNLLGNAIEAMGERGRLTVRTRRDGGNVALDVVDTGPGIPPEVRPKIFDPFFTTKRKGNGLGLSICRQIVISHGGSIGFVTETGKGTTFTVVLPPAIDCADVGGQAGQ